MNDLRIYKLTLHKTYYDKGFFNLGVEVDDLVRKDNGPVFIRLGDSMSEIEGKSDRSANLNGTPRIFGGAELRNWIQSHFEQMEVIDVVVQSPTRLWLRAANS